MSNINKFIQSKYDSLLTKYKQYIFLNYKNRLSTDDISDIYNDSILLLIERDSNTELKPIKDLNYYFYSILKNETRHFLKKKDTRKQDVSIDESTEFLITNEEVELLEMEDSALETLKFRMIDILSFDENMLFLNYFNNKKISFKKIATMIGCSNSKVYLMKKSCFSKVKNELLENYDLYFKQ